MEEKQPEKFYLQLKDDNFYGTKKGTLWKGIVGPNNPPRFNNKKVACVLHAQVFHNDEHAPKLHVADQTRLFKELTEEEYKALL